MCAHYSICRLRSTHTLVQSYTCLFVYEPRWQIDNFIFLNY
ncbi:hypothetical protein RchiOBHm_Chr2g0085881 [Rosa chinensis]|uniref:Uncharacterized protein n=1 Tax=Rosa chinensis TaxID=74649 RepID=A0A2P6RIB3_ROSCH|nr:hypothetical protein RchiOBHm_Chr2g0085881 [Rosa chinensis]